MSGEESNRQREREAAAPVGGIISHDRYTERKGGGAERDEGHVHGAVSTGVHPLLSHSRRVYSVQWTPDITNTTAQEN